MKYQKVRRKIAFSKIIKSENTNEDAELEIVDALDMIEINLDNL